MANPLQQFFRQPKIYISLPSKGAYCQTGTIQGDITKIPVYGMTGMDELLAKTPDALLNGESSVKIIESCCPNIKNAWDLSSLDSELIFAAIRIATYGNSIEIEHTCTECKEYNKYDIDLGILISHFSNLEFDASIILDELTVKIQPLNYKKKTDFALKNFQIQQKLFQVEKIEDEDEKSMQMKNLWKELSEMQLAVYHSCVDSVQVNGQVVTEKQYIDEWLANCDRIVFEKINKKIEENLLKWRAPKYPVTCGSCNHNTDLSIDLDQSNFFV
jgi:hypothetical protein